MITQIFKKSFKYIGILKNISGIPLVILFLLNSQNVLSQDSAIFVASNNTGFNSSHIVYYNPRVFNVNYTFELHPDSNKINKSKDLKIWIPVPREWDSQKAVKIIAIEPIPDATYEDPEYGNKILFWDFGKKPIEESYKVNLKYRCEVFEVYTEIDSNRIAPF